MVSERHGRRYCYASVHRMHIWTARIETPEVQWMFRIRMALAYHDSEDVLAYLESTNGWQDMLSATVKYLHVAGLNNVKVSMRQRRQLLWEGE